MKKQKDKMETKFDLFGSDIQEVSATKLTDNGKNDDYTIVCEAIQIVRVVKGVMGSRREFIDTIKVDGSNMTYERAKKIAKAKAEKIGNCMVIEKLERIIQAY